MPLQNPRNKTVKRLFAVSGNRCCFPKCKNTLIDKASGKVTGRICHIKGKKKGSLRYDPKQTDEERHGFDNLLLMCPIHHDIIDDDDVKYIVAKLKQIKAEHEALYEGGEEPSDDIVYQFIMNLSQTLLEPPGLRLSFDKNKIKTELKMSTDIEEPLLLTLTNVERREKRLDRDTIITLIENKSAIQKIVDEFNEENILYHRNKEFEFFLLNRGNFTCNDIDLTITTTLEKEFRIRHEKMIKKPYMPPVSHFSRKNISMRYALEKVSLLHNDDEKKYPFEYDDLIIDREDLDNEYKWYIKYHINDLRHNDFQKLEPIKLFIPKNPTTKELVFTCSFIQRERGMVEPQTLKTILI